MRRGEDMSSKKCIFPKAILGSIVVTLVLTGTTFGIGDASGSTQPLEFSKLSIEKQRAIGIRVEPPPISQRDAPYSTPMYYLFDKGYTDGINKELITDRNHPDW